MEAAKQVVKENDPSIEALNAVSNRLDSVPVNLGIEETEIRCQLWRLKVKGLLSGKFRVQFQVINSWYNEGRKLDQNVSELEKLVAQGGRVKEQFSECDTLEELEKAIAEESELPFDLTQIIIEQKARIQLMGKLKPANPLKPTVIPQTTAPIPKKEALAPISTTPLLPQKRVHHPNISGEDTASDPIRKQCYQAIETALLADFYFLQRQKIRKYATRYAKKIEIHLFAKNKGSRYKQSIETIQKVILHFQIYAEFSKKLLKKEISVEDLCAVTQKDLTNSRKIRDLFKKMPKVTLQITKGKKPSQLFVPPVIKKPKLEKKPSVPKEIKRPQNTSLKDLLANLEKKPSVTQEKAPPAKPKPQPRRKTDINALLHGIDRDKEERVKASSLIAQPEEPIFVSDKYRYMEPPKQEEKIDWSGYSQDLFEPDEADMPSKREPSYYNAPEPTKLPPSTEMGIFSSDEDDLPNDPQPTDAFGAPVSSSNYNEEEEYNVMEYAKKSTKRSKKKTGKQYDPYSTQKPKNHALLGSLLKVWSGMIEYNKRFVNVDMMSIDNIESFHRIVQLPSKLVIQGRTKQSDLEQYISQNPHTSGGSRIIATAWMEPLENKIHELSDLVEDLKSKDRAAVIRVNDICTIYLTNLSPEFLSFLNKLNININQRINKSIRASIGDKIKLGCILYYKKTSVKPSYINDPEVIAHVDPKASPDSQDENLGPVQVMSPITSEEEEEAVTTNEDIIARLQPLIEASGSQSINPEEAMRILNEIEAMPQVSENPEMRVLIETIRGQVEAQISNLASKQSVSSFLSQNQF